jgi:Fic family protein
MSQLIRSYWQSTLHAPLSRRQKKGCSYDAYLPDPLMPRTITLDGPIAADTAEAEAAIARLDTRATSLANTEALARILLRAESIASSRIEGLIIGARRLLRAQAAIATNADQRDITAAEILANIDAMAWSLDALASTGEITLDLLLETHRRLLAGTSLSEYAGHIRTTQNWIGGTAYSPCQAAFIPPPPEHVLALLEDLCAFANSDGLPAIAQAALAHAQFETIHPFADGNGRTGRAMIHLILRRRGLALNILPPISLILATWSREYIGGLTATRYRGEPTSPQAHDGMNKWIGTFAAATLRATGDAMRFEERMNRLESDWRTRLGKIRAGSAADLLIRALPGAPIITTNSAAALIGRSYEAANLAIARLTEAGILTPITLGRRNRAFEAAEVIDGFEELERRLSSPVGDTRIELPSRPVPAQRR